MLEIFFRWARIIFLETLRNNMWWCRGCLTIFSLFLRFFETQLFSVILQLWSLESFSLSNSPLHRALGRYRHTSSSRQIHNILCWLEILNYCPDGGNGNFHCSSYFFKATSLICVAFDFFRKRCQSFAAHQKYILCFFSLWWMIKGITSYLYFCETGSHGWIVSCS